jgi:hypothetical protein
MSIAGTVLLAAAVGWFSWRLATRVERTRRAGQDVRGAKNQLRVARRILLAEWRALARVALGPAVAFAAVYILYLIGRD